MKCPICGAWTTVLETRMKNTNQRRRTLECGNLHKFRTIECIDEDSVMEAKSKLEQKGKDDVHIQRTTKV